MTKHNRHQPPRVGSEYYCPCEDVVVKVTKVIYDVSNDEWKVAGRTKHGAILNLLATDLVPYRKGYHG